MTTEIITSPNASPAASPPRAPSAGRSGLLRRLARRELHSPRSTAAITLAVILVLVAIWIAVETVLALIGIPPLLVSPGEIPAAAASLPTTQPVILGIAGALVLVLGIMLLALAVGPGRRHRHLLATDRVLAVVDDEVIASALAQQASATASTHPDGTIVAVGRRTASIRITPASGITVDRAAVDRAVAEQLETYALRPALRAATTISTNGKVGQ
ncbi:hypothetical protein KXS11_15915 [Plantibacter flavus]|uniref:hypothetical protein n=1 Tax=Plantibacter flavus TaxID=150123 RepID=UPI003F13A82D